MRHFRNTIGRQWAACIALAALAVIASGSVASAASHGYNRLMDFIALEDRERPLHVFKNYEEGFDASLHQANLEYLNSHPGLISKIRAQIKDSDLRWRLKSLRHRLLFVPENRREFAALYEDYCRDIIHYVLDKTEAENPFQEILTLDAGNLRQSTPAGGVRVFLVHNLAKEFQATNIFAGRKTKKVEVKLNGRIFVGDIGSFSSQMEICETGGLKFTRNAYTIWQNSAANPYTALMTPAEETLHVLLRPHTERAINARIILQRQGAAAALKATASEWIAVEEAVAGAVAHHLVPLFLKNRVPGLPASLIEADVAAKLKRKRYRYLSAGIRVLERMGLPAFLNRYRTDPGAVRQLLQAPPS